MAQGDFKDLIYKSTQTPVAVNATNSVDRLLGISPDGDAVVVDIKGANEGLKVLVSDDIIDNEATNNASTDKAYSCRATTAIVNGRIVANKDSETTSDTKTYSCKAIRALIGESGGGGGSADVIDTQTPETYANTTDKTFSCKTTYSIVNGARTSIIQESGPASISNVYSSSATKAIVDAKVVNNTAETGTDKAFSCNATKTLIADASLWQASGNDAVSPSDGKGVEAPKIKCGKELTVQSTLDDGATTTSGARLILKGHYVPAFQGQAPPEIWLYPNETITSPIIIRGGNAQSNSGLTISTSVFATAFYESSDASLKTNVMALSPAKMSSAADIPLVEFDWKEDGSHSYGTIAQEVEKTMPELVSTGDDGHKTVNYIALLCAKVAALEAEVAYLKTRVQ